MKTIFEKVELGALGLKNRLVRSATYDKGADHGAITSPIEDLYEELAKGGVGLIVTGMVGIGVNSSLDPSSVRADRQEFLSKFSSIADKVHRFDGRIVVQLSHCGIKAGYLDEGDYPIGPSQVEGRAVSMTPAAIESVVADFGAAAKRCREAGADGVQIQAAHGWLLSQFLSPYFNRREDGYGGSLENRSRMLFEVYDEVRRSAGDDYPVFVKMNYSDLVDSGLESEECLWVCKELERRGIDAIELSAGIALNKNSSPSKMPPFEEGYFGDAALSLAAQLNAPVITVGGYRTLAAMQSHINAGNVAAVALSRPLIREPALPRRWQSGDETESRCISCNKCFLSRENGCPLDRTS